MTQDNSSLAARLESARNAVDSVVNGLQEVADKTDVKHLLWALSIALETALPTLEEASCFAEHQLDKGAH